MSFESKLVQEVNDFRRNPYGYAAKIAKYKKYFEKDSNNWKQPRSNIVIKTEEGPAAFDEAIDFLKNKSNSRNELTPSKGLTKIAEDFLKEYQKDAKAEVELEGIVKKHGKFTGFFRRLVQLGSNVPEYVVISLVVGDGDKTRAYRDALLAENLNKIGVAHGDHKEYRQCSVITVCNDFTNEDGSNDAISF